MAVPSPPTPIPRGRFRRVHRAVKSALTSTLRPLQQHHFTLFDLQYLFLFVLFSFCFWIMDKPLWFKLPIALIAIALLIPRRTRLFMLPFFAPASWLILFYCCRFIPSDWRPHIFTSVLPALENILYGGSISEMLAQSTTPFKDILGWIPYGVLHYVLPIVTAILIVCFGPPGTLPVFARTFGYMNVAGVLTQIFFPCAPPWYETRYGGLEPATYSMPGDPGGLARVDDILGVEMYKTTFTASPLVFGAFPSLHSADAWQLAFFLVYIFGPRAIPFAVLYVFWIWWATMYLGHHYVVDLVGGGAYAVVAFWLGSYFLPTLMPTTTFDLERQEKGKGGMYDSDAVHPQEKQTFLQDHPDLDEMDQGDEEENEDDDVQENNVSDVGRSSRRSSMLGGNKDVAAWQLGRLSEERDVFESSASSADHQATGSFAHGYSMQVDTIEMSSVVVTMPTLSELDIAEARQVHSEPSSPTGSDHSSASTSSSATVSSWSQRKRSSTTVLQKNSNRQSWGGWQGYESWVEVLTTINSPRTSPKGSPKSTPAQSPRTSTGHRSGAAF
ncbi:Aureobasidin resistance protein Aur1 [Linnemannia schmuckeri]|uniref:Aureobasidin resistance protein Aur1 n=1 Tax=Linnemannia schmuckeri TaxID=64567 RepID=A0A9P5S7D6_9FUNG|nr:Aureobasidin resistance protein Aur1 [Linnemannia schmuckeri]